MELNSPKQIWGLQNVMKDLGSFQLLGWDLCPDAHKMGPGAPVLTSVLWVKRRKMQREDKWDLLADSSHFKKLSL